MNFDLPACHGCGAEVSSDVLATGTCPACGKLLASDPEEARRYIHKARNSGNAAEAYDCCCQALAVDPRNAIAWAERFRISFWLNSELKGNSSKIITLEQQLAFLEQALKTSIAELKTDTASVEIQQPEEIQQEVAKIIIRFYISEFMLDQWVKEQTSHPQSSSEAMKLDPPFYLTRFQHFIQILTPSLQTRLKEELIYLTGEALNKSLSATCRTNQKRQNFLSLGACLTIPVSRHPSPLYIRIYETLEGMAEGVESGAEDIKRTGFLCLVSSNQPDAKQENTRQSGQRSRPNYEISDWPLGVQIASTRTPETALSAWLTQWVLAYQVFLGIDTSVLSLDTYDCLGSPSELATQLDIFSKVR